MRMFAGGDTVKEHTLSRSNGRSYGSFHRACALGASALLAVAGCDGFTGPALDEASAGTLQANRSGAACVNVKGTGFAAGSAIPDLDERVSATGPIEGDLTGTMALSRSATDSEQKGNGATFLTYDDIVLDSNELGTFTGIADASINFGLLEEGVRSLRGPAQVEFTGPGDRHGFLNLTITFDLTDFPWIEATYRYHGRLCEG